MSESIYLVLHRALFVGHAMLAAFVAGGTGWLVVLGVRDRADDPGAVALRDLLPFVLGLAITFGIGPLLFVQLIDGHAFYTANLLLSHRFMSVLPALIVGFYLLYLQKTRLSWVTGRAGRVVVPLAAFVCFGFTAWSFSESHLLAQSRDSWPGVYANGAGFFWHADLPLRLLVFAGVAAQVAAVGVGLRREVCSANDGLRTIVAVALGGAIAVVSALGMHPPVPGVSLATIALVVAIEVVEIAALVVARSVASSRRGGLVLVAPMASAALVERIAALRESVRIARGGANELAANASTAGFGVFVCAAALAVAAIALALTRVRTELRAPHPD